MLTRRRVLHDNTEGGITTFLSEKVFFDFWERRRSTSQRTDLEKIKTAIFFFFSFLTLLLPSFCTSRGHMCRPFSPPGSCLQFFIAHRVQQSHCSSIFHRVIANSRSRAFRKSICAQEKVPTNLYEHALGGARTHETDLYQA